MSDGFLGLRSTADWVSNQRPENWMQAISLLFANGDIPLTGLTSMARSEKVTDPKFHWWEKGLAAQRGAVTGIYTDSALSTAYTSGGTAGDVLYFKVSASTASHFRPRHQVLLRDSSNYEVDVNGYVVDVVVNGANSYIAARLLEDDDNSSTNDLSDCDTILIIGNANAEGAAMPDAVSYDPTERWNYAQIFRSTLEVTETALVTKLRTDPDYYAEVKRETLQLYGIEVEKALIWGKRALITGDNGKPVRFTMGLVEAIQTYGGATSDFRTAGYSSGTTWDSKGKEWLDNQLKTVFRYGSQDKLGVVGDGAMLGIARLAESNAQMTITPETTVFGLDIIKWVTPFGSINLKVHPLFSYETTNANTLLIYEPKRVKTMVLRPTRFKPDANKKRTVSEGIGLDAIKEEFIGEFGFKYDHAETFAYLNGVGLDVP